MLEGYAIAAIGFVAMTLYGYRSGTMIPQAGWGERLARLSFVLLLLFLGVGFLDVAANQSELLWRQWLIGAALAGVAIGQAALLRSERGSLA